MNPDEVLAQLGVIAMAGSAELPGPLGDLPDPADGDYSLVAYDPGPQDLTTPAGRVRQRLKDLVDDGRDIRLFGVGPDFLWSDGSTIADSAGGAIGDRIFYDTRNCDGDGRWVRGTDGEQVCVSSAGILYHELGHVFLSHPDGSVDEDERAAVVFENDLRDAEGRVPRDPDHWPESECGCSDDCCIVASVATGSPLSSEVHALRGFRDRTLRRTVVGMRFFDVLHCEYYRFSVGISRVLVTSEHARNVVADWLVRPLVAGLELARHYAREPNHDLRLGELALVADASVLRPPLCWESVSELVESIASGESPGESAAWNDPALQRVVAILRETLPSCPHVRWAIVGILRIYVEVRRRVKQGGGPQEVGAYLRSAFDEWTSSLPLEFLADHVTSEEWAADMPVLAKTLFASVDARVRFGARLAQVLADRVDEEFSGVLRREGYLP